MAGTGQRQQHDLQDHTGALDRGLFSDLPFAGLESKGYGEPAPPQLPSLRMQTGSGLQLCFKCILRFSEYCGRLPTPLGHQCYEG